MEEIVINSIKDRKSFSETIIENKELIYPAMFYIAGLIIGTFLFGSINSSAVNEALDKLFNISNNSLETLFFNRLCTYFSLYTVTVLLGMCLIGFPFINIIPLIIGFSIAIKTSYYYVNFSAKGIGFAVLMIIPEAAAFLTVLIYTIKTSAELSKCIYNTATKKSDTIAEINLKLYLKSFLIYGLIVALISLINALASYLLGSIISI